MSDPTYKPRRVGDPIASSSRREINRSGHSFSKPASSSSVKPRNTSSSKSNITSPSDSISTSIPADEERIYNRLLAIGMPSTITLEDFARIVNRPGSDKRAQSSGNAGWRKEEAGSLRDALEFLSVHFVGRDEARKVRACISRAREEHAHIKSARPQSRIKVPTVLHAVKAEDVLDDPRAASVSLRETAYRSMESAQREYEAENARIGVLDKQQRDLMKQLEDKRRIELLFRVLEKRETVRVTRLGLGDGERKGLGALVRDLRKESNAAMREFQSIIGETKMSIENFSTLSKTPTNFNKTSYKYKHTTNALANFHARHRRLVRRERESEAEHAGAAEANANALSMAGDAVETRLEEVLRRLGVKDKAGLEKMKRTLVSVAQRRAAKRQQEVAVSLDSASTVDDTRLADMHKSNEEKRREVQEKINRAVAVGWLCEGYIDLVSTFRSETAPSLNEVLREGGKRVEGHVDVLRTDIFESMRKPGGGFAREVREVMGTTRTAVWDEVRDTFGKVGASGRLVSGGDLGVLPERSHEQYEMGVDAARNAKVLERKTTKAEYGFRLVEEVREMLADVKRLK